MTYYGFEKKNCHPISELLNVKPGNFGKSLKIVELKWPLMTHFYQQAYKSKHTNNFDI